LKILQAFCPFFTAFSAKARFGNLFLSGFSKFKDLSKKENFSKLFLTLFSQKTV
jgi:hypothetical protein